MALPDTSPTELLRKKFKFEPTHGQEILFDKMGAFLLLENTERSIFVLKGYAGTGKTTFLSTLIKVLPKFSYKAILMAPTGRAAKVMAAYSKRQSQTIHRKIYKQKEDSYSGNYVFELQKNLHEGTLFIVDEASMISDVREFGRESVLHDLISYVYEGSENKLLLIGDEGQLPPVGVSYSPALNAEYLENHYYAEVMSHTLTEVVRQKEDSGILYNATAIRQLLTVENPEIKINTRSFPDIFRMNGDKIEAGLRYAYDKFGQENVTVITRSNKQAVQYNQFIRNRIHYAESEIDVGDIVMIVKNNYTLLEEGTEAGFIANGEFAEIVHLGREEEMHGLRFIHATLKLTDYPSDPEFDALLHLDTLSSASPGLTKEQHKELYESVLKDYYWVKTKKEKQEMLSKDIYLNALQVKFAYALTCHKAQGGQWEAVFVDQGYLPDNTIDTDYLRWLYTAITRGVKEVFMVNFNQRFF